MPCMKFFPWRFWASFEEGGGGLSRKVSFMSVSFVRHGEMKNKMASFVISCLYADYVFREKKKVIQFRHFLLMSGR